MIKVDRSFVQGVEHDAKDAAITANLSRLAHALGVVAIAEGIESQRPARVDRRALGCDLAQGYLFAHPLPADECGALLPSDGVVSNSPRRRRPRPRRAAPPDRLGVADVAPDHVGPAALLVALVLVGEAVVALAVVLGERGAKRLEPPLPVGEEERCDRLARALGGQREVVPAEPVACGVALAQWAPPRAPRRGSRPSARRPRPSPCRRGSAPCGAGASASPWRAARCPGGPGCRRGTRPRSRSRSPSPGGGAPRRGGGRSRRRRRSGRARRRRTSPRASRPPSSALRRPRGRCRARSRAARAPSPCARWPRSASVHRRARKYHGPLMFDTLSDRLQGVLGDLGKKGRLDEEALSARCARSASPCSRPTSTSGSSSTSSSGSTSAPPARRRPKSVDPGAADRQDRARRARGAHGDGGIRHQARRRAPHRHHALRASRARARRPPAASSRCSCARRAASPLLVAADLQRPAAVEQLERSASRSASRSTAADCGGPGRRSPGWPRGRRRSRQRADDVVILDTAGRLHVDEELMDELTAIATRSKPHQMLLRRRRDDRPGRRQGRRAVRRARSRSTASSSPSSTATRAAARRSRVRRPSPGKPIKFVGIGEKLEDLEPFHPERMASRILGMGDVVSLVERAAEAVDKDEAKRTRRKDAQGPVHASTIFWTSCAR